jgi:LAO/AO transport system kinase
MDDVLQKRARSQLIEVLKDEALKTLLHRLESRGITLDTLIDQIKSREKDPYTLVQDVLTKELRDFAC